MSSQIELYSEVYVQFFTSLFYLLNLVLSLSFWYNETETWMKQYIYDLTVYNMGGYVMWTV